jgi:CBS domain containing-hemolysin-like protein
MSLLAVQFIFLAILLTMSAFFSATEIAYTGLNLSQIKRVNRLRPGALDMWEKHPERILATLLLSNNAVNIAMGVVSANMAAKAANELNVRLSILTIVFGFLVSAAVLIFGEIIPKILGRHYSAQWILLITPIMDIWTGAVDPFAKAATRVTNGILVGFKKRPNTPFLQENELKDILSNAALPSHSKKILDNLVEFSSTTVRDIMIPRTDIVAIANDLPFEKIVRSILASGYSRIPVYNGTLNRPMGILYAKDILVAMRSGTLFVLDDLLRPAHFVEPNMSLSELFRVFKTGRHHMAIVRRGELGPVEGLVTLQDALETIAGDITEEI